jgi:hypothetical protein
VERMSASGLDPHADQGIAACLSSGDCVPSQVLASNKKANRPTRAGQIAPPDLAVGPTDGDRHRVALVPIEAWDRVLPATAATGVGDQRDAAASKPVHGRSQNRPQRRVDDPVHRQKGSAACHPAIFASRTGLGGGQKAPTWARRCSFARQATLRTSLSVVYRHLRPVLGLERRGCRPEALVVIGHEGRGVLERGLD